MLSATISAFFSNKETGGLSYVEDKWTISSLGSTQFLNAQMIEIYKGSMYLYRQLCFTYGQHASVLLVIKIAGQIHVPSHSFLPLRLNVSKLLSAPPA